MQKIASFQVDHNLLTPGIYISRVDFSDIVTYDLRFNSPNAGDYLDPAAAHTIEHLFATAVRSGAPLAPAPSISGPWAALPAFILSSKAFPMQTPSGRSAGSFSGWRTFRGRFREAKKRNAETIGFIIWNRPAGRPRHLARSSKTGRNPICSIPAIDHARRQ